jgi:hypothetical protein
LYLSLPPIWGAAGGDLLNPHYSWEHKWIPERKKKWSSELKKEEVFPTKGIPKRNSSAPAHC